MEKNKLQSKDERRYNKMEIQKTKALFVLPLVALLVLALPLSSALNVGARSESSIGSVLGDSTADAQVNAKADMSLKARANSQARTQVRALDKSEVRARVSNQAGFDSGEFNSVLSELDASVSTEAKATSFTSIYHGNGWAISDDSGEFIRIIWAERTYIDSEDEDFTRSVGFIKASSSRAHKISLDSVSDNSISFDVYSEGEVAGSLELEKESNTNDFIVWSGSLDLKSEEYDVSLATINNKIRSSGETIEVDLDGDGEVDVERKAPRSNGLSFWGRFKAFFRA